MKLRKVGALAMAAFMFFGAMLIPGGAVQAEENTAGLSTDNMSITWDADGVISSLVLQGKESIAESPSGFILTDAATDMEYGFRAPVTGGTEKKQSGTVGNSKLKMDVTYRQEGHAIYVDGTVTDTSGSDRLITLEYILPMTAENLYWYEDISTRTVVKRNGSYSVPVENYLSGHKMSMYPFATVSNGSQAVAIGVPMEEPQAYLLSYENVDGIQGMRVKFDFALTKKTTKLKSKAKFSFVIYAPTLPEWGFRSASQDYYDLYPESFASNAQGGGNWLFQHAYDQVDGVEDFYFGYNETPGSYLFDDANGVTSLEYTAPAEQWMEWPGMPKEPEPTYEQYMGRFEELLNDTSGAMEPGFLSVTQRDAAAAMKNSATLLANGKYFTVGWYAYGVSVCFITNHNPDIPGWNSYKLQISEIERAEAAAKAEGTKLGGVYIDNLAGLGSYNYREDHFRYADLPLLWDADNRLVLPSYSSMYSYTKGIRERSDANDQIVFANMVFPERGVVPYIHMLDAGGSEIGPSWGWDPYIQRLRRTMAYRKTWCLLLGHDLNQSGNWGASYCPMDIREDIMKSSVAYGLFANVIGYRVELQEYENARPLFRKYTYTAIMEDRLGWNPVTFAQASGTGYVDCERYGDLGTGAAIFTMYNTGEHEMDFSGKMTVDLRAMNVSDERAGKLVAYDTLNNTYVPITVADGKLTYDMALATKDVSAVIIGTKAEIWEQFYDHIKMIIQRGDDALVEIPQTLEDIMDEVPSAWSGMEKAMKKASPFKSMDAATALKSVATLATALKETIPAAKASFDEMYNCYERLEIDVLNIYQDAYAIVSGLFGANGEHTDESKVPEELIKPTGSNTTGNNSTGNNSTGGNNNGTIGNQGGSQTSGGVDTNTIIIVACAAAVVLVALGGAIAAFLLTGKKVKKTPQGKKTVPEPEHPLEE